MGIDALSRLIKISPEIAEQHQLAVIDCLEVRKTVFWVTFGVVNWSMFLGPPLPCSLLFNLEYAC